jgi:hypothetical protein
MLLLETTYDRHLAELRGMGSLHVGRVGKPGNREHIWIDHEDGKYVVGIHVATRMAHGRCVLGRHRSAKAALREAYEYIRDCEQADSMLSASGGTV